MAEPSDSRKPSFPRLTSIPTSNYTTWLGNARAELQTVGVWLIVKETVTSPPTTDAAELREFLIDSGKAAGLIFAALADDQKVHIKGMEENPVAMWKALEKVHHQKKPGARFAAYIDLFSIVKGDDETLNSLITR
ncbi:hypothetical protein C8J56DRAFT_957170, partial [Mycena floridula]